MDFDATKLTCCIDGPRPGTESMKNLIIAATSGLANLLQDNAKP